jgi:hypothetical protein
MEGEEEGDSKGAANSEIRYMTLELMKLAQKSGKSFDEVAREYLENAEQLHKMILGDPEGTLAKGRVEKAKDK